jgi:hypothetical protein
MSRIAILMERPKTVLAALASALAAVGLAAGLRSRLHVRVREPGEHLQQRHAHAHELQNAAALLTAAAMKPGETKTGSVTITNTGTLPGTFTLTKSSLTNPSLGSGGEKLSDQIDLVIKDGDTTVYSGKLGAMSAISLDGDLGAAGTQQFGKSGSATATHTYDFTVTLPAATGDAFQGTSTSVQYDWTASS